MQNADAYISRHTRRRIITGVPALATLAAFGLPLTGSKTEQAETTWQWISQFRQDLLTLPVAFPAIAEEVRAFALHLLHGLKGRINRDAERLRIACLQLLRDVGEQGCSLEAFQRLDGLASYIDGYWFDKGEWPQHAHALLVHAHLYRAFSEVLPIGQEREKQRHLKNAMRCIEDAYNLLRGRCRKHGANGDNENVVNILLHHATILRFKLRAYYGNDPYIRSLALPDKDLMWSLAREINTPRAWYTTLCEEAGYRRVINGDPRDAQHFLEKVRNVWLPGFPMAAPQAVFPVLRAELEVFHDLKDARGEKSITEYHKLFPQFPSGLNRQHIAENIVRFGLEHRLTVPTARASFLTPAWPVLDMEPTLKAFYSRM
jgi:hypothetical protein